MRRGFKTEANGIALEVRGELGLKGTAPLNPWQLADHLAIPVVPLSEFEAILPKEVAHFRSREADAFSAVTVFREKRRLIVHNDAHGSARQASNVAHELAHCLLEHPPAIALDERGLRHWDDVIEEEANFLTGALLVPVPAALYVARRKLSLDAAASAYGVSVQMMRYRLNITGAHSRAQRRAAR